MKVIICGSRNIKLTNEMLHEIIYLSQLNVTEIISGCDKEGKVGTAIDKQAIKYAKEKKIQFEEFPAYWDLHGLAAGPIRNNQMANIADACIAIWDGSSKGTKDMIEKTRKKKLPIFIYRTYGTPKMERINY